MENYDGPIPPDSLVGSRLAPTIIPWAPNFPLDRLMAALSTIPKRVVVRITGGCANMSREDARDISELFVQAFMGFEGLLLIGGTRMILGLNPSNVLFGITEVGPAIRRTNENCVQLGIIPRTENLQWHPDVPVLVVKQTESANAQHTDPKDFITIVHPDQDLVIAATTPLTKLDVWDDEVEFCRYLRSTLIDYGRWQNLTIAYNGGNVTERELRGDANRGWLVLLIKGSGRKCDELANDTEFTALPNVVVCERNATSMRLALQRLDAVPREKIAGGHLRAV